MDVRVGLWRKLSTEELMLLNCGVGEDSWESLRLQEDPTSPFWRSVLGFLWKEWCWSWNSSTLATSCKELTPWKVMIKPRQCINKQRHYFANKSLSSQGYGFSNSHVWMWELDYKESWAQKNWCFWTVMLEKTLESPLDCKEIQPVHPKGNQSWIFIGRTDVEAETPILWPSDVKNWLICKDPDAGKDWEQEEKGTTEDEMVGWHHRLNGHEFE